MMVAAKMHTSSARLLAIKLLAKSETSERYIDHLLESSGPAQNLSPKDRALLQQLVNGVLKNRSLLDLVAGHYIRKGYTGFPAIAKNIFRTAFYELIFLQRIPEYAVVSETVQLAKKLLDPKRAKFVNAVLRSYLKKPFTPEPPSSKIAQELACYYSHPRWLVERFIEQYGEQQVVAWLQSNNRIPPIYLRLLQPALPPEMAAEVEPFEAAIGYYRFVGGSSPTQLAGWRKGTFIVQDPAAGLVLQLAAVQQRERVIDLCAAPGGKAIALATGAGPDGHVVAVEVSERRAQKLRENIARTGLQNITVVVEDARKATLPQADLVLVDAPCSGLGVLSRRADLRWQRQPSDFAELIELQHEIIDHAAKLVAPGGRLIYATCSIDRAENEAVVERFLRTHPHFILEHADRYFAPDFVTTEGYLKTLPHLHGMDGVFAARFAHTAGPEAKAFEKSKAREIALR